MNVRLLKRKAKKPDPMTVQLEILRILAGQAPGYDAFPNATCFHIEGHTEPPAVHEALEVLADAGLAVQYVYDVEVEPARHDPREITEEESLAGEVPWVLVDAVTEEVPGGYEITDAGREWLAQVAAEQEADA